MARPVPERKAGATAAAVPRLSRAQGLELSARAVLDGLYAGSHRSPLLGSSLDFAEHRAYQPGDDLRALDWRAYARTDRLLLRRWHDDRQLPLALLLDTSASLDYGLPTKRARTELAAAILALLAADQGDAVRLCPGDEPERWHSDVGGTGAGLRLCDAIARAPRQVAYDPAAAIARAAGSLARRSLVLAISDFLHPAAATVAAVAAAATRGHEVVLLQVIDRSELELPAGWGRCVLNDPEERLPEVACDAAAAKGAYDAAMAAHIGELAAGCAGARADFVQLIGDQEPVAVLAAWLARRRAR